MCDPLDVVGGETFYTYVDRRMKRFLVKEMERFGMVALGSSRPRFA